MPVGIAVDPDLSDFALVYFEGHSTLDVFALEIVERERSRFHRFSEAVQTACGDIDLPVDHRLVH